MMLFYICLTLCLTLGYTLAENGCTEDSLLELQNCVIQCTETHINSTGDIKLTMLGYSDCVTTCYLAGNQTSPGSLRSVALLDIIKCNTDCYRKFLTHHAANGDFCGTLATFQRYSKCFGTCMNTVVAGHGARSKRSLTLEESTHKRVQYLDCYLECVTPSTAMASQSSCEVMDLVGAENCNSQCLGRVQTGLYRAKRAVIHPGEISKYDVKNSDCLLECLTENQHSCLMWDLLKERSCFNGCVLSNDTIGGLCSHNNGGCEENCDDSTGSVVCSCKTGYQLNSNKKTCKDIDECLKHNCGSKGVCQNTPGSFTCKCNNGFEMNPVTKVCVDKNECAPNGGRGPCYHFCSNFLGGYSCRCRPGFNSYGPVCSDINECNNNNGGCEQICHNYQGSYDCGCRSGYNKRGNRCDQQSSGVWGGGGGGSSWGRRRK